jgi:hypothetical protein
MAITLLGYFSTMAATLVALMMLLNNVLSSGVMERAHHKPYPYPVFAQAAAPDNKQAAVTDKPSEPSAAAIGDKAGKPSQTEVVAPARLASAKQLAPDRNQRQKLAVSQSRKEDAAGRQQDREYSLALGYAQEPQQEQRQSGQLFDLFGSRRF